MEKIQNLETLLSQIFASCKQHNIKLTTAESCTGGLVAELLTYLAGASQVLDCAFVVYNEVAKIQLISVATEIIENFGVVSTQCAEAMAIGAVKKSPMANLGIATTGVAGPTGGDAKNLVGTVCFALYLENPKNAQNAQNTQNNDKTQIISYRKKFDGNRQQIRQQAAEFILAKLSEFLQTKIKI